MADRPSLAPLATPREVQVRRAEGHELGEIARVLADAFSDYPWTRWTVDARDHRTRIEGLQRLVLEHVGFAHGEVWVATVAGTIAAAEIWTDSRRPPPDDVWTAMAAERRSLEGDRHEAARAAEEVVGPLQPEVPHLYLGAVGTRSGTQGRGLGSQVLAPVLAAADDEQIAAFLETSSERNVGFYRRLGFDIVSETHIRGGPWVCAMLRRPVDQLRAAGASSTATSGNVSGAP